MLSNIRNTWIEQHSADQEKAITGSFIFDLNQNSFINKSMLDKKSPCQNMPPTAQLFCSEILSKKSNMAKNWVHEIRCITVVFSWRCVYTCKLVSYCGPSAGSCFSCCTRGKLPCCSWVGKKKSLERAWNIFIFWSCGNKIIFTWNLRLQKCTFDYLWESGYTRYHFSNI